MIVICRVCINVTINLICCKFNSISVICLSVRNRAGDGTETVPTASLFAIIFLLRFLALLIFMFFYVKQIVSECSGHL